MDTAAKRHCYPDGESTTALTAAQKTPKLSLILLECRIMENLVTIATFDSPAEAEVARLALEEHGIRAFLADDNLVGMNWLLSNAVGGAKL